MFSLRRSVGTERRSGKVVVVEAEVVQGESAEDWNSPRRAQHPPLLHLHGPSRAKLAVKSLFLLTDDP